MCAGPNELPGRINHTPTQKIPWHTSHQAPQPAAPALLQLLPAKVRGPRHTA